MAKPSCRTLCIPSVPKGGTTMEDERGEELLFLLRSLQAY